jgi:hypothetical protein
MEKTMTHDEVAWAQARNVLGKAAAAVHGQEHADGARLPAATMARAFGAALRAGLRCDICNSRVQISLRTVVGRAVVRCSKHALRPSGRRARTLEDRQRLVKMWRAGEQRSEVC